MPDCRPPVEIPLTALSLQPIVVSLRWKGPKGPVLTGDDTKFALVVSNKNSDKKVGGQIELRGHLTSPFTWQGANPIDSITFAVGPGREEEFPVPDHWMFVEGKFSWVTAALIVNGHAFGTEHPLASFTVFERSTYNSQTRSSRTNLLIAATAAASSILAAVLGFVLLVR